MKLPNINFNGNIYVPAAQDMNISENIQEEWIEYFPKTIDVEDSKSLKPIILNGNVYVPLNANNNTFIAGFPGFGRSGI